MSCDARRCVTQSGAGHAVSRGRAACWLLLAGLAGHTVLGLLAALARPPPAPGAAPPFVSPIHLKPSAPHTNLPACAASWAPATWAACDMGLVITFQSDILLCRYPCRYPWRYPCR